MENYFTDAMLYENPLEASNKPIEKSDDRVNEADFEP